MSISKPQSRRFSFSCLTIWVTRYVGAAFLALFWVQIAVGTPSPNAATINVRVFNDCPLSVLTVSNNYPASIQMTDQLSNLCTSFANLHTWSFSENGGTSAAIFHNNSNFHFAVDFKMEGSGEGDGGLRISPWFGKLIDGRMQISSTTGQIQVFGGRLPFYDFTLNHGIAYSKGTTIRLEITYRAHDLFSTDPATIRYRVVYNGNIYDSPELPFDEGNPFEANPYGLWGMLNDARVGGFFQPLINGTNSTLRANWSNVTFQRLPPTGTPLANAATINERVFNDCPLSVLTVNNNYPASIQMTDQLSNLCTSFANLHTWSFSENGGTSAAIFHNNSNFHFAVDFKMEGSGEGDGGLRISYLEPPAGYSTSNIDIGSIRLNGSVPVVVGAPVAVGDFDRDGIRDLALKFDRAAVAGTLGPGNSLPFTITGLIGNDSFTGTVLIRASVQ